VGDALKLESLFRPNRVPNCGRALAQALRPISDGGTLLARRSPMSSSPISHFIRTDLSKGCQRARFSAAATALAAAIVVLPASMASARGPENVADVAEQVIDAVVNVSTSQKVDARMGNLPDLPPGSPMEEFFEEFFKNRRRPGGQGGQGDADRAPRRINSLGSGFIIDASGLVVTNNHVIADADEIN